MSHQAPKDTSGDIWTEGSGRPKPMAPVVTRTPDSSIHDSTETHPSYGAISASHVSGRQRLFGSDFDHQHFMTLRIKRAEMNRSLNRDWMSAHEDLIEVAMSEAQWATMLATPNSGDGVPCTIEYIRVQRDDDWVGHIPALLDPPQTRQQQFGAEVRERQEKALEALRQLEERIKAGKGGRESLSLLAHARAEITGNMKFTAEQFDRHMEKTVERAKIEIGAYATRVLPGEALKVLKGSSPIALPEEPAKDRDCQTCGKSRHEGDCS